MDFSDDQKARLLESVIRAIGEQNNVFFNEENDETQIEGAASMCANLWKAIIRKAEEQ